MLCEKIQFQRSFSESNLSRDAIERYRMPQRSPLNASNKCYRSIEKNIPSFFIGFREYIAKDRISRSS